MRVRTAIAAVLFSGACMGGKDRFVAVEAEVRQALPLGMKVEDVTRVLDSMGIAHSRFKADSGSMRALVGPVEKNLVTRADAQFEFVFDTAGRLSRITAKKIHTGP